jgi:hypothetical protein
VSSSIINTKTRKMLIITRFNKAGLISWKAASGAGGEIGVQMKSLLFVLVKSHNLVFSGLLIVARLK